MDYNGSDNSDSDSDEMPELEQLSDAELISHLNMLESINQSNITNIKKENNEPTDFFEDFKNSLNINIQKHNTIKCFCDSLEKDNVIHDKIKQLIIDYNQLTDIDVIEKDKMISQDIFNNQLTDCTIIFPDKTTFTCLKIMLKRIEYFSMILEEFDEEFQNEIQLTSDPEITISLIKMIYSLDSTIIINPFNFCGMLDLMQIWLMSDEYIDIMLNFANTNTVDIILYQLEQQNFDNIITLESHLLNIMISKCSREIKTKTQNIINSIYNFNFGEHILKFNNWQSKFSSEQKIIAIKTSNNLELLNTANISYVGCITFLSEYDFANNDIYCDFNDKSLNLNKQLIRFRSTDLFEDITKINTIISIDNYFPTFTYSILDKIPTTIYDKELKTIIVKFNSYSSEKIIKGSQLVFDDMLCLTNEDLEQNSYIVVEITKVKGSLSTFVTSARYTIDDTIYYRIKLDKIIKIPSVKTNMWIYNKICHNVEQI